MEKLARQKSGLQQASARRPRLPVGDDFILLIRARARAPSHTGLEKSTTEMKDLDINIGHNRQPPESPTDGAAAAAAAVAVVSSLRASYPLSLLATTT